MAELNEVLGTIGADGTPHYPAQSISGRANYERPPTQIHMVGAGKFVVLDIFPPPGFNTADELDKIKKLVAAEGKKTVKPEPPANG